MQVLSSLAPGVDQIAVDEALNLGCQVRCPLPFPPEFYRHASTFRRGVRDAPLVQEADPPGTPPEQREQGLPVLTDEDRERQRAFDQILERVGRQHAFWVRHHDDLELRTPISSEALADDLCGGRLAVIHEGGYAEAYVPFCGLAVVEALSG